MVRPSKRIRRNFTALLLRPVVAVLSWMPRPLALMIGRCIGAIGWHCSREQRQRALHHLELALGDTVDAAQRMRIARGVFRHFGETAADVLVMQRMRPARIPDRIPIVGWTEAAARYDEVLAEGKGLIALTAHLGNWELFAYLGSIQWPDRIKAIGRRYTVEGYNRLVERIRVGMGVPVIYQDESPRAALRVLRDNGVLGILADQDAKHVNGIFVDFFGRPAYTPSFPAGLCHRMGCPLVPVFVVREGKGYRVIVHDPIRREHVAGAEDPVKELTQLWTRVVEDEIRAHPEQWVWTHKRWNTTPEILERRRAAAKHPG